MYCLAWCTYFSILLFLICCPVWAGFVLYIYSNCICCPVWAVFVLYIFQLHMLSCMCWICPCCAVLSSKSFLVYILFRNVVLLSYKSCPANVTLYMLLCCSVYVRPVNANCMCCPVCCPVYIFQYIMSCKYCSPAYIIRCPVCVVLLLSYACYLVNIVLYSFPSTYCSVIMHMQYA